MKSKKIVALALVAAMSISMASMTAFAAKGEVWSDYLQYVKGNDTDEKDATQAYAFAYQQEGKDVKYHIFLTGTFEDTQEKSDGSGNTYTKMKIGTAQSNKEGNTTAELTFGQLKGLEAPGNDPESDYKFVGWSLSDAHNEGTEAKALEKGADLKANGVLQSGDSVIDGTHGVDGTPLPIYPVYQVKNSEDKKKDYDEISARPKIAKGEKDDDWKYTAQEIEAHTFGKKGEEAGAKESCEKCNTTMAKASVYDVKPVLKGTTTPVVLRKSQNPKVDVVLPIKDLPAPSGYDFGKKDDVNKAIKDGKLKVFHIGSDGKSHPVSGVSAKDDGSYEITFKYGTFSDFVVTTDDKAKAQAGEEESASSGNPATGEASALPVAMLALAALSATGVVAYKKRKAE